MPDTLTNDAAALSEMKSHLAAEAAVYEELLTLAQRQQRALVARRVDDILDITARQVPLTAEAGRIETAGRAALARAAHGLGLAPGASVSDVAARLDPARAAPLAALRDRVTDTAERLAETNWINRQLLESAMDAVRFTVRLLAEAAREPEAGYPAPEPNRRAASLMLDQRA